MLEVVLLNILLVADSNDTYYELHTLHFDLYLAILILRIIKTMFKEKKSDVEEMHFNDNHNRKLDVRQLVVGGKLAIKTTN